jgi:hypothetical protein
MGKNQWLDEDDDSDWEVIEKMTRNFKGSADEIEEILDEGPTRKKHRKKIIKFSDFED